MAQGLTTVTIRRGEEVSYPPRCASCNSRPDQTRIEVTAASLVSTILLIAPLVGIGSAVVWHMFTTTFDMPIEVTLILGYGSTDVCLQLLRSRGALKIKVPLCHECAARVTPRWWADSLWFTPLNYALVAAAYYLLFSLYGNQEDGLRLLLIPMVALPRILSLTLSRRLRAPASAVSLESRVDITFKNTDFARDVRQMNLLHASAG